MKKVLLVLLVLAVAFSGCRKDNPDQNDGTAEVQFGFTQGLNLKDDPDVACFDVEGDYAFLVVNGTEYYLDVFYLNGIPYTQSIKLPVATDYEVEEFMLMNDNNTPNDTDDDYAIMAAPHATSAWAGFVDEALNITFDILTFDKIEILIEVLCYEEDDYSNFGFVYFMFYEIVVRQECFFGDICIKSLEDYLDTPYADQPQGLQYDMPAIFYIEVWRNDVLQDTYSNFTWLGVGAPLCVWYADRLQEVDDFEFKLFIAVDDGAGWSYKYFHSWFITDDGLWAHGDDGIMDFVLGSCVLGADLMLMPYMDLPLMCQLMFNSYNPGATHGTYMDLNLAGIPAGYDLYDGVWPGWCVQAGVYIDPNQWYNMDVYSSLYVLKLPAFVQGMHWDRINWLMNNLDWYTGDAAYAWYIVQQALWKIAMDQKTFVGSNVANGGAAGQALAEQMYQDAFDYGTGFVPLPGYWAAVVFVNQDNPEETQIIFTIVDP